MIELTNTREYGFLINPSHIVCMKRQTDHKNNVILGGGTCITLAYNLGTVIVLEDIETIKNLLK